MGSDNASLIVLVVYRVLTLLAGLALVLMGYRLFRAGFLKQAGDVEAGGHGVRVALKRAAPGTVFAVLGAAVMVAGIWKGLSQESEVPVAPPSVSPLLPQSFSPPSASLHAGRACRSALRCVTQ